MAGGKQSEAIKRLVGERYNETSFNNDMERMESPDGIDPVSGIRFIPVQPGDPDRMTSRMTMDRRKIVGATEMGREDMIRALEEVVMPE